MGSVIGMAALWMLARTNSLQNSHGVTPIECLSTPEGAAPDQSGSANGIAETGAGEPRHRAVTDKFGFVVLLLLTVAVIMLAALSTPI
jgi:hypothetical protein